MSNQNADKTEASPVQQMLRNLFLCQKRILQQSEQIVHSHGFTTLEFDALSTLYRLHNCNHTHMKPSDIVKNLCVSSGGITKVLKSLEQTNHIAREDDHNDKRIHWVTLTQKGQETCHRVLEELLAQHQQQITPALSESEVKVMANMLEKLANHLNPF